MAERIAAIENLDFALPRIVGQIKMGKKGPSSTGSSIPKKLDYFELTTLERKSSDHGNLVPWEELNRQLGEKPKALRVSLLYDSIPANCATKYGLWSPKEKCYTCIGDGNRALEGKDRIPRTCTPAECEAKGCKPSLMLICTLQDFPSVKGPFVLYSRSWYTLRAIMWGLNWTKENVGILAGLPFVLSMQPKTAEYEPGKHTTIYFASLSPEMELHDMLVKAKEIRDLRLSLGIDLAKREAEVAEAHKEQISLIEAEVMETGEFDEPKDDAFSQQQQEPESEEALKQKAKAAMTALGWKKPQADAYLEETRQKGMTLPDIVAELQSRLAS